MTTPLNAEGLDLLFLAARTHNAWLPKPVSDDTLRQLYDLMKWGPTSANCCPARILFVRSPEAKERLRPALSPGNLEKTMSAPVTAISSRYPTKNAESTTPFCVSVQPRSSFIAMAATEMLVRSM